MDLMKKPKVHKKTGPKPEIIKIKGDWRHAIKESLAKRKPPDGWPK